VECRGCGLLSAIGTAFDPSTGPALDEEARIAGLRGLREANFGRVLDMLTPHLTGPRPRGLEVGPGHGWFMEMARVRGIEMRGVEPEPRFAPSYGESGLDVVTGFYPDALPGDDGAFDFVIFNDVFEHIPYSAAVAAAVRRHLKPGGLLVVNLPLRTGVFYRLAELLHRLGVNHYLERMWQFGFPSPHCHYFSRRSVTAFARRAGFSRCGYRPLITLQPGSARQRIAMDRRAAGLAGRLAAAGISMVIPVLRWLPEDIGCFLLKKRPVGQAPQLLTPVESRR
jgi:SAM-dependent methyltransferase